MSKKFMIVKPTFCCGNNAGVGMVFEAFNSNLKPFSQCVKCKHREPTNGFISFMRNEQKMVIEESRIVWLPYLDEEEKIVTELENIDENS